MCAQSEYSGRKAEKKYKSMLTATNQKRDLLEEVRKELGDSRAFIEGYTVYDRDGNYVVTLSEDGEGNPTL